jgi:hypothetical protein
MDLILLRRILRRVEANLQSLGAWDPRYEQLHCTM